MSKQSFVQRSVRAGITARHTTTGELLARHAHQSLVERVGKVGYAKMMARLIPDCLPGELRGLRRMTAGNEQAAYTDGQNVLKVIFGTLSPDENEVDSAVEEHQARFDVASRYMGTHLAPTTYSRLSLYGWYAVGALQEHQHPRASFEHVEAMVAHDLSLDYRRQLGNFASSIGILHEQTSLYPDLIGQYNVLLAGTGPEPELRVVDNMLVTSEMQQRIEPKTGLPIGELITAKLCFIKEATAGS